MSKKAAGRTADKVTVLDRLARAAMRQSWRRGVVGGSSAWTALGGLALIGYLGRRALRRDVEVVFSEELAPGESIRITHEPRF